MLADVAKEKYQKKKTTQHKAKKNVIKINK